MRFVGKSQVLQLLGVLWLLSLTVKSRTKDSSDTDNGGTYEIEVWIDYNWNVNEIDSDERINYTLINDGATELLAHAHAQISTMFNTDHMKDLTESSKQRDAVYNEATAKIEPGTNTTVTEQMYMKIEADIPKDWIVEDLESYVGDGELAEDVVDLFEDLAWTILDVRCKMELQTSRVVTAVMLSIFCVLCLCVVVCLLRYHCCKPFYKLERADREYLHNLQDAARTKNSDSNLFVCGWYTGYRCKVDGAQSTVRCFLSLTERKNNTNQVRAVKRLVGHGTDVISPFTIAGNWSQNTQRMVFDAVYLRKTGKRRKERRIHPTLKVQLEWNQATSEFRGNWRVEGDPVCDRGVWVLEKECFQFQPDAKVIEMEEADEIEGVNQIESVGRASAVRSVQGRSYQSVMQS